MMDNLLLIVLILIAIWYWWDTQQCNEIALLVCQRSCRKVGLQLLDATVIRQKTWLRKGDVGLLQICRLYSFEYVSPSAAESEYPLPTNFGVRENGYIVLIGKQVVETHMPKDNFIRDVN